MENTRPTIKELLKKHGELRILTDKGRFSLIKSNGHFFYSFNKLTVGISDNKLDWIISQIPSGISIIGWE